MKRLILIVILGTFAAGCSQPADIASSTPLPNETASSSYDVVVEDSLSDIDFSETGNISCWNEVTEECGDSWKLIYDQLGQPAATVELVIDEESVCVIGNDEYDCREVLNKDFNGDRLHLQGMKDDNIVYVKRITF